MLLSMAIRLISGVLILVINRQEDVNLNFAEQLNVKKDLKVIKFADEFLGTMRPILINSAAEGYSAYKYTIDTDIGSEKKKLQLYSDPLFVSHLNENFDGVKVTYENEFVESLFRKGYGRYKYHLRFSW